MAVNKSDPIHDFSVMPLRDDNPSRVDLLGFDDIVVAIESTITREELQRAITVGVNAPWGWREDDRPATVGGKARGSRGCDRCLRQSLGI